MSLGVTMSLQFGAGGRTGVGRRWGHLQLFSGCKYRDLFGGWSATACTSVSSSRLPIPLQCPGLLESSASALKT